MKGKFGATMAMLLAGAMVGGRYSVRAEDITGSIPEPPIPKGCKLYLL
jgi:hypothetical protein